MKRIALAVALSIAVGGSAFAAEKVSPSPACMTLGKIKATVKNATFTPLNIGQFNFVLGVYDAIPPRGPLPAADNAVLLHVKGKTAIIWMKAECASVTPPTGISEALATDIRMIRPTAGETSDAPDDSQDLHL